MYAYRLHIHTSWLFVKIFKGCFYEEFNFKFVVSNPKNPPKSNLEGINRLFQKFIHYFESAIFLLKKYKEYLATLMENV